jgi:hypothetical protein
MLVGLDILTGLMALVLVTGILLAFVVPPLDSYIGKLPDTNKLKKWWRNHIVGDE